MAGTIDQLIVNGPCEEPAEHWRYERESRTFSRQAGRRPAGYVVATPGSKSFDDPGAFVPLPLVEIFLASDRLTISPAVFQQDPLRRRILLTLNMNGIVRHLWEAIRHENTEALVPVFDGERPIRSTGDMLPWYTGRPWADTERSHISRCVLDSA